MPYWTTDRGTYLLRDQPPQTACNRGYCDHGPERDSDADHAAFERQAGLVGVGVDGAVFRHCDVAQIAETQRVLRSVNKSQAGTAKTLKFRLRWSAVLTRNARRPVWASTTTLTRSFQLTLWTAAMRREYHRHYAACQYTLTGFNRLTLTSLVEGIIK